MRRSFLGVVILAAAGCVEVPDTIRAQFAAAAPAERSNYRPGRHGTALPLADADLERDASAPAAKAAEPTASASTPDADADAGAAAADVDGGAP